jgi:hypothetical protein
VKGLLILDSAVTISVVMEPLLVKLSSFSIKAKSLLQGRKLCPEHRNFWRTSVKKPHSIRYQ